MITQSNQSSGFNGQCTFALRTDKKGVEGKAKEKAESTWQNDSQDR